MSDNVFVSQGKYYSCNGHITNLEVEEEHCTVLVGRTAVWDNPQHYTVPGDMLVGALAVGLQVVEALEVGLQVVVVLVPQAGGRQEEELQVLQVVGRQDHWSTKWGRSCYIPHIFNTCMSKGGGGGALGGG